ncbi:hypothetical protein L0337_33360 [candidate division KSB1 bacterium]|nr:hypothetical protein [candidate division KSB1 bacterium]
MTLTRLAVTVVAISLALPGCASSNDDAVLATIKRCEARLDSTLTKFEQKERLEEALAAGQRELEAARAAGDTISLARTLMSNGATLIATGGRERGLVLMEEARKLFEARTSDDYRQGLGWYWILQADLAQAGFTSAPPAERIAFADSALHLLLPLKNWPGVARAYAARAQANKILGNNKAAADDSTEQAKYQTLVGEN